MKAKPCTVLVNTRNGYVLTPFNAKSIRDGIRQAKESCGFAYRIYIGKILVAKGFCD